MGERGRQRWKSGMQLRERERCDETRPPFDQFLGITWDVFRNIAFTYLWLRWKVPEEAARSLAPPSCFESFERCREGGREAAELFPAAKAAWALHWVEINSVDGRRF